MKYVLSPVEKERARDCRTVGRLTQRMGWQINHFGQSSDSWLIAISSEQEIIRWSTPHEAATALKKRYARFTRQAKRLSIAIDQALSAGKQVYAGYESCQQEKEVYRGSLSYWVEWGNGPLSYGSSFGVAKDLLRCGHFCVRSIDAWGKEERLN